MTALVEAKQIAEELRDVLHDTCTRIRIAGSIRRQKPDVSDAEIVAEPRMVPDEAALFDDAREVSALDLKLTALLAQPGFPIRRVRGEGWGDRHKKFHYRGLKVDLFIVRPPASWGVIYAIRTGPADFSHLFVTPRSQGGALPEDFRVSGGELLCRGNPIATPTEKDFFTAIDVPWWAPADRTAERLRDYLKTRRI